MKMNELEKYELVNKCETEEELAAAILTIANGSEIEGRNRIFDAEKMSKRVQEVINGDVIPNVLTRKYGIRQQALYIKYYQRF
jgi:hypothetical protein